MMVVKMFHDVVRWLLISMVIVLAFAAGLYHMLRISHQTDDECAHYQEALDSNILTAMGKLFFVALDSGEANIDCLSSTTVWGTAPAVMVLYLLLSVILLMNMLIAMMAKTFDDYWERQKEMYRFTFAQVG